MFPLALHGFCGFYIKQNVRNRFKNDKITTIFDHESRVYHIPNFDSQMIELMKIHTGHINTVITVSRHDLDDHKNKWSRHRFFLYGCDRLPGVHVLKLETEIHN